MNIDFYRHSVSERDIQAVSSVLRSRFLTTGPVTARFESELSSFLGLPYTLGLTSCTAGLFLALKGLGIGKGHEVIVPPLTFVSTVNVIEQSGAKPVFCDVDPESGILDPQAAGKKISSRTRAILPVHLYGRMADMRAFSRLTKTKKIALIEDAAHCVEGELDGLKPGTLSDAVCFSFYATKNITSGEGGAVSMKSKKLYDACKRLRLHGLSADAIKRYENKGFSQYDVKEPGYKFNMNDIQASLLRGQLKRIRTLNKAREKFCGLYEDLLSGVPGIGLVPSGPGTSARHLFPVLVPPSRRTKVIHDLNKAGISVSVHFHPVHFFSYYKNKYGLKKGSFPEAERIGLSVITLPLYPSMSESQVRYIARSLKKAVRKAGDL